MGDSDPNQVIVVKNCKIVTGTKDHFLKDGKPRNKGRVAIFWNIYVKRWQMSMWLGNKNKINFPPF